MTRFGSADELFEAVGALIESLRRTGHGQAAAKLQQGFASLNGLTDGWALFLESIEDVQDADSRNFIPGDKQKLDRIQKAVRAAVFRR